MLPNQKKVNMLNIVDEATGMQICVPLWKGKKAEHARTAYRKNWKRWAGVPKGVLTDGGTEFDGSMQQGLETDGSFVEKTSAYAPWQNGITERAGGIWKQAFMKAVSENQRTTKTELREHMDEINHARNSMTRKHGYAPYQHVFGADLRLPGDLLDQLNVVHNSALMHGVDPVLMAQRMRQAARAAFVRMDEDDRIRRALEQRSRPERGPFEIGDTVFYWRVYPRQKHGRWHGPAVVLGKTHGRSKLWVAAGARVSRCAMEQLRRTTPEPEAAIRMISPDWVSRPPWQASSEAQKKQDFPCHVGR